MSTIKLIVSDLHLADGSSILDCFGDSQQTAFEALLRAASSDTGPLVQSSQAELIINGDCFDFLVTMPYTNQRATDVFMALQKLEKIITAHASFFAALRAFVAVPGRSVTFLAGNHDIELCFSEVRARICSAIVGQPENPAIYFCPTRFYHPLPDVYVEHGNYYDFWNHASEGLWDEAGQQLTTNPQSILLPVGTRYFQQATYEISLRHPYFDHLEPSMSNTRQIALLCLLDPDLIIETAQRTMKMLSYPRLAHAHLTPEDRSQPVRLFEETVPDFMAFREDMVASKTDWVQEDESTQISSEEMIEFMLIRDALACSREEAVAVICSTTTDEMEESVTQGMQAVLGRDPSLRYAIAGHTHMARIQPQLQRSQIYLNTGSWTSRFASPVPDEVTPALVDWLQEPQWNTIPLRDVTQFVFALVTAEENGPAHASLCAWEGKGYRVLASEKE